MKKLFVLYDKDAKKYIDKSDNSIDLEDFVSDYDLDDISYDSLEDAKYGIFEIDSNSSNYEIHEIVIDFCVKQKYNVETKIVKIE